MALVNTVIAGEYANGEIKISSNGQSAYIFLNGKSKYINKLNVESVKEVNKASAVDGGGALVGYAIAGGVGMLLGGTQEEIILEIYWEDGKKSLIKATSVVQEAIIVSMYNDVTPEQEYEISNKDESARKTGAIIATVIALFCVILYAIPTR